MKLTPEQIIELENETISLCQELIRIPSVNHGEGKGDEKAVAEFIASKLAEVGIESELIETAKIKNPNLDLQIRDLQENPFPTASFDYVVCSQVFNFELGGDKNNIFAKDMIRNMYRIARHGVAVDLLTNYVDFKEEHLHYYRPEEILSYAKELTRRVMLRHDYPLFEFCIYLYPNFEGWSEK